MLKAMEQLNLQKKQLEQNKIPTPKRSSESKSALLHLTDIAFRMGGTIAIGTFVGRWIDKYMNLSSPIFTLLLCLLSVGYAIYIVYRDASQTK
jgi:F0F1-type ATP synthase assembly protein I